MTYSPRPSKVTNQIVYDELVRAARAGEACPSNSVLRALLGATSISTPARAVRQLHQEGRIRLTAHSNHREIYVVELGVLIQSAFRFNDPAGSKREAESAAWLARAAEAAPLPPVVDRDPCFRCGVRADIGCEHSPVWSHASPSIGRAA